MVWGVFPCTPQWAVSAEWWGGLYQGKKCTGNAQKCAESALYPALPNLLQAANVNRESTDGKGIPEEKEEEDGQGEGIQVEEEGSWVVQHESGRGMVRKKMGQNKEDAQVERNGYCSCKKINGEEEGRWVQREGKVLRGGFIVCKTACLFV